MNARKTVLVDSPISTETNISGMLQISHRFKQLQGFHGILQVASHDLSRLCHGASGGGSNPKKTKSHGNFTVIRIQIAIHLQCYSYCTCSSKNKRTSLIHGCPSTVLTDLLEQRCCYGAIPSGTTLRSTISLPEVTSRLI